MNYAVKGHRKMASGSHMFKESLPTAHLRKNFVKFSIILILMLTSAMFVLQRLAPGPLVPVYLSEPKTNITDLVESLGNSSFYFQVSPDESRVYSWKSSRERFIFEYPQIIFQSKSCKNLEYLTVVNSALKNFELRQAIRDTWGKFFAGSTNQLVFLFGSSDNLTLQALLEDEAAKYKDVIQFSFSDTYRNATLKSILMLKWAQNCNPKFLIKADDDTMINVKNLQSSIEIIDLSLDRFIAGFTYIDSKPIRDPKDKWFVPVSEYGDPRYPTYVAGCTYVITGNVISSLLEAAHETRALSMEDVFITGMLAFKKSIPRLGLSNIKTYDYISPCMIHETSVIHYVTPARMREYFRTLQFTVRKCETFLALWTSCSCSPRFSAIAA